MRVRPAIAICGAAGIACSTVLIGAAPPVAAGAAACYDPDPGAATIRTMPWAQKWLDPQRVWPFATGSGVRVAVLDSGVDAANAQLTGRVDPGLDLVDGGDGRTDCVSHGTAVASVIAARGITGIGFRGIAPAARILPVRVSEQEAGNGGGQTVPAAKFAQAISGAADAGARVIDVSVVLYRDYPQVRAAVVHAQRLGALVVAPVGDQHRSSGVDATPYPAAYPGVLGVGAIDVNGSRVSGSQVGGWVDLVAPGAGILAAVRLHGQRYYDGTSFAAAFVAGSAALVRSAHPTMPPGTVAARLMATATPAPAGPGYGHGVVNPDSAVQDVVTNARPVPLPTVSPSPGDAVGTVLAAQRADRVSSARHTAVLVAALALLALALAGVLTFGRRRDWRVGQASVPTARAYEPPQTTSLFD